MKKTILLLSLIFWSLTILAQNKVNISLVGKVNNFTTSEKLFGSTLYMIQNGRTVSKAITDETGNYSITGFVNIDDPIDLLVSKPGYASKKVLFDIKTLKVANGRSTNLQLLEELIVELYENRTGADLGFTKNQYAEKFTWDQTALMTRPDTKYKSEIDKKVNEEYSKVVNNGVSKNYVSRADIANKNREFEKAVAYYDSALVSTPKDSTIKLKKDNVLATIQKIKLEELKKAEYEQKKSVADQAFQSGSLLDSEKKYKELLKSFPGDSYATSQISKITAAKAQEEQKKKDLAEAQKLITLSATLVTSGKYEDAILKLQQASILAPDQKQNLVQQIVTIKSTQSDKGFEEQLKKDLKSANDLGVSKKYDEAIKIYKSNDSIIRKFSNQVLIDKYSKESQLGLQKVLDKKNSEDQAFKAQLAKATENFEKGPAFYSVAENILKADPMKSRINEPVVIELKDKIQKMNLFYSQKNASYNLIKQNKLGDALNQMKSTLELAKKNGAITPAKEITQLVKTIDSLDLKVNPKTSTPNSKVDTTRNITKLPIPGEEFKGNPVDLFNVLSSQIEEEKEAPLKQVVEMKNDLEYEAYFNKKLNDSRQEDENKNIRESKTEIELIAIEKSKEQIILQENLQETKREFDAQLYKKQIEIQENSENRNLEIQDWKNTSDSLNASKNEAIILKSEENVKSIQKIKDQIEIKSLEIQKQNNERTEKFQDTKNENEYSRFKKDSVALVEQENRAISIQKTKDYNPELKNVPNHLSDEKGVEFPWNKMTEKVYQIKNKEGYVTSIITRRIVVDKFGYGVVYEQNTNEKGVNSYLKNGVTITEFIWINESSGLNVIEK
jgi:hypothetical protein